MARWFSSVLPKGLYARALIIMIVPMIILQSVVAYVFLERHWSLVTNRLSARVVADIAALIEFERSFPQDAERTQLRRIALENLELQVDFLPLPSRPLSSGVVPVAGQGFVSQQHPEGRITFISLDAGVSRMITGFELSAKVVNE